MRVLIISHGHPTLQLVVLKGRHTRCSNILKRTRLSAT